MKNKITQTIIKIVSKITLICSVLLLIGIATPTKMLAGPIKVVVIDAGHGGHDPGAVGKSNVYEKNVNLKVALKLGELIESNFKDIKVVYTRKTDVFVELKKRTQIANENHADLFISIHCNSVNNSTIYGSETFVMSPDNNSANLAVAQKENAAILYESNYKEDYAGYDPNSTDAYILFSLYQNAYLNQSIKFASKIQEEFRTNTKLVDRGVKQAGFLVLWRTTMPSVLVEIGFLSNPKEEAFLASEKGQNDIANSLFRAFAQLVKEKNNISIETPILIENNDLPENKEDENKDNKIVSEQQSSEVVFRIQISCLRENKKTNDPIFKGLENIRMWKNGKYYCYTAGEETSYEGTTALLEKIKTMGFKDAFITAYKNEEKISIKEAKEHLKQ